MARPRAPIDKAEVSGAIAKNAGRYTDRKKRKYKRPLGEPYLKMTEAQKEAWEELKAELPWLTSADRVTVRLACRWIAELDERPESFGVSATQALSSLLSKLGATPADVTKVSGNGEDEEDDTEEFFGPH